MQQESRSTQVPAMASTTDLDRIKACPVPAFTFGADPELFFQKGRTIVGAEKVLKDDTINRVVLDGVQAEIHPLQALCRVQVGTSFTSILNALKVHLTKYPGVKVCWKPVVRITQEEMDSLSDKSKQFGCQESLNIYGDNILLADVDASKYPFRSAGGHIHIGLHQVQKNPQAQLEAERKRQELANKYDVANFNNINAAAYKAYQDYITSPAYYQAFATAPGITRYTPEKFIPLLDAIVGNTGVMLERDPLVIERRRYYGRAGEYRLPKYGIEYRVLSNWWMRGYPLMSLVFGLTRLAGAIIWANSTFDNSYYDKLMSKIDTERVQRAINTNNLILAKGNWSVVRDFIDTTVMDLTSPASSHILPLGPNVLEEFDYFLKKGINHWFPLKKNYLNGWMGTGFAGWEMYLTTTVRKEMKQ